jgi:mono/diheme cytochrome c family protein
MVGAVATGIVIFALGVFLLWLLVYGSGLVRPKVQTEPVAGAPAMERKLLFATALVIFTGVFLTGYGFWDPMRQASARERQLNTSVKRGVENYAVLCYGCHGEDGKGAVVPGVEPKRVTPQLNREQFWVTEAEDPDTYKANFELVNKTIHRGRNQIMPAWGQGDGGTLNDEQIYELTAMILNGNRKIDGQHTTWEIAKEIVDEHIAAGSPTPIPVSEAAPPLPPELQAGRQVFEAKGCIGCHAIQGVGGAVGPNLTNVATAAETREPGKSAEEYLRESILSSTAFVVSGYPPVMPSFQGNITDQELNDLVRYLLSLK